MDNNTAYHFFSWTREGLSVFLQNPDAKHRGQLIVRPVVMTKAVGSSNGVEQPQEALPNIQLYGPADILGFDPRIISRCTPQPDAGTFEPNYFPAIEFSDPDFAWRYTPFAPKDDNLQPWITLIVLAVESWDKPIDQEFKEMPAKGEALPRAIQVKVGNLPDLRYVKFWTHVQVTDSAPSGIEKEKIKEKGVCRILCPRRLSRRTRYAAFVVPTFKIGLKAGLGEDFTLVNSADPAWDFEKEKTNDIQIPYYYKWEFITGETGDFEYLVDLLEPRELTDLGTRPVDCSRPGFGIRGIERHEAQVPDGEQHCLGLEGALRSNDTKFTPWGFDRAEEDKLVAEPFQSDLAELLPKGDEYLVMVNFSPKSGLAATTVRFRETQVPTQLEVLVPVNLPGSVTLYYRKKGEADYSAVAVPITPDKKQRQCVINNLEIGNAYEFYLGIAIGGIVSLPGLSKLYASDEQIFTYPIIPTIVPPTYGQWHAGRNNTDKPFITIKETSGVSQMNQVKGRLLSEGEPVAGATIRLRNTTLACITKVDGTFTLSLNKAYQKVELEVDKPFKGLQVNIINNKKTVDICLNTQNWYAEINLDPRHRIAAGLGAEVIRKEQEPLMASAWEQLDKQNGQYLETSALKRNGQNGVEVSLKYLNRLQLLLNENRSRPTLMLLNAQIEPYEGVDPAVQRILRRYRPFKRDIQNYSTNLSAVLGKPGIVPVVGDNDGAAISLPDPSKFIKKWVGEQMGIIEGKNELVTLSASEAAEDALKEIMWAPSFDRAMYEPLRDLGQEFLLPGLEKIPPNTVGLLSVNRRFLEAYMCGLNHEFGKELLWRGFPTDQRGTYFQKFWDYNPESQNRTDINIITKWGEQLLGKNGIKGSDAEPLVLVIRGDLLQRYPNARIYLANYSKKDGITDELEHELYATLPPDITFLGFDSTKAEDLDYFIFEEHICEPRFGLDETGPDYIKEWPTLAWSYFEKTINFKKMLDDSKYLKNMRPQLLEEKMEGYTWNRNGASQAWITQQRPVKLVVPKTRMMLNVTSYNREHRE